jgi:hypothetical protein
MIIRMESNDSIYRSPDFKRTLPACQQLLDEVGPPPDGVVLGDCDPTTQAIEELRQASRNPGPVPTRVELPPAEGTTVPKSAPFRGAAPVPAKLDLNRVVAARNAALNACQYSGRSARGLTGVLPHYADLSSLAVTNYGNTNQCANFASSFAQRQGLRGHYNRVPDLKAALIRQHWKPVRADQARPGDLWIRHDEGHAEVVTRAGSPGGFPQTTGANNNGRQGMQHVSTREQRQGGTYYSRPCWVPG